MERCKCGKYKGKKERCYTCEKKIPRKSKFTREELNKPFWIN